MIDLLYITMLIANMTPTDSVATVDWYIERNTNYTFFYWARNPKDYLKDSRGDCTDKALLKCAILRKKHIPCATVWGYNENNISHAWYKVKLNNTWVSSEPKLVVRGNLLI